MKKKPARIVLEKLPQQIDPLAIKNFAISSENTIHHRHLLIDHPIIFDGIALIICTKGSGRISINFQEYELEKNTIVTIMPHFIADIISKTEDLTLEYLIFSLDFIADALSSAYNNRFDVSALMADAPCAKANDEELASILEFHGFIAKQYKRQDHPFRKEIVRTLLYALLSELGSLYVKEKDNGCLNMLRYNELVQRFFELMRNNFKKERTVGFYADKMYLTPKYLSAAIKEATGRGILSWLNYAIIMTCKVLLKTTDMTVLQISEELNYPNSSFLCHFFKKHTGMTPLQYRNSK